MPRFYTVRHLVRFLILALALTLLLATIPGQALAGKLSSPENRYMPSQSDPWLNIALQVFDPASKNWDIYVTTRWTADQRTRLTTSPAFDGFPRWNNDATRLVFVSQRDGNDEIYTMSVDGSNVTRLTNNPFSDTTPSYSPDGARIVFVSERDGNPEIYTMHSDGSGITRLTSNNLQDYDPDWSPDGQQIVWVQGNDTARQVYVMNPDGSNPHPLSQAYLNARRPVWSPIGDRLAVEADENQDGWQDLIEISADGTGALVLPIAKTVTATYGEDFQMGGWSADGQIIYFSRAVYTVNTQKVRTLQKAELIEFSLNGLFAVIDHTTGINFFPAVRSRDPYPPETTIDPIPQYSLSRIQPIHFTIQDRGPSGIDRYKMEASIQPDGPWSSTTYLLCPSTEQTDPSSWSFTCYIAFPPGNKVTYRLSAVDKAGNWTVKMAQVTTTVYTNLVEGQVLDNRGYPIASAVVDAEHAINTVQSDEHGRATVYLGENGPGKTSFTNNNFGSTPPQTWDIHRASQYLAVLPPKENLMVNGDFESSVSVLDGWQLSGDLPVQPGVGLSGDRAALLGQPCENHLCVTPPETFPPSRYSYSQVSDSNGVTHFLATFTDSEGKDALSYFQRYSDGTWSTPETIGYGSQYSDTHKLRKTTNETLYFIGYGKDSYNPKILSTKPLNGSWTFTPISLPGTAPIIQAYLYDDQDQFYAFYRESIDDYRIHFVRRNSNGSWTTPVDLPSTWKYDRYIVLASGPLGEVHVIYEESTSTINPWYARINPDGSFSNLQKLPLWDSESGYDSDYKATTLIAAQNGELHFLASNTYRGQAAYWKRTTEGIWIRPEKIYGDLYLGYTMLVGQTGEVHIFQEGGYYHKPGTEDTFIKTGADLGIGNYHFSAALNKSGYPQFSADKYYTELVLVDVPGEAAISQIVSIPEDMNFPTLSFRYKLDQEFPGPLSDLVVTIDQENENPVQVFVSAEERGSWLHGWADLSDWAGQTVTVTFHLRQAANEWNARLSLDEISLGAWNSPAILSFSPQQIASRDNTSLLRLQGYNLSGETVVFIGAYRSPDVTVDPDTGELLALIPPELTPGRYAVYVLNPDGLVAYAPSPFQFGFFTYSPFMIR